MKGSEPVSWEFDSNLISDRAIGRPGTAAGTGYAQARSTRKQSLCSKPLEDLTLGPTCPLPLWICSWTEHCIEGQRLARTDVPLGLHVNPAHTTRCRPVPRRVRRSLALETDLTLSSSPWTALRAGTDDPPSALEPHTPKPRPSRGTGLQIGRLSGSQRRGPRRLRIIVGSEPVSSGHPGEARAG